jgi:hypothetical protein
MDSCSLGGRPSQYSNGVIVGNLEIKTSDRTCKRSHFNVYECDVEWKMPSGQTIIRKHPVNRLVPLANQQSQDSAA